jgi:cytochrome c-type biogenesis protein
MTSMDDLLFGAERAASGLASAVALEGGDPGSRLLTAVPAAFAAGLLTGVSPCAWGLLPVAVGCVSQAAAEGGPDGGGGAFLPAAAYAAGLAAVFCSLGVAAAVAGGVLGSNGQSTLLPVLSNAVCLVMGLKLLELIDVPLPSLSFLQSSNNRRSDPVLLDATGRIMDKNRDERGPLFRTFLLGGSSALAASPCATPVLASILAHVAAASDSDLAAGALLLLGYAAGHSAPLLLAAAAGGRALAGLRRGGATGTLAAAVGPWVTPLTGGFLLWYGTNGMLVTLFGDPSLAGMTV